ncbi:uncharacterized protein LOC124164537 isoform X2 [Ischnura elegans]|uniref:uncharacterized protein LOC124164537 isoform X2 n=1 Tax=Ischnura elegans TaxID=197161 RepID=UPI001ED87041|nr:uncharacterized protein LOC124164537 isoform X2 [Ischnura elegans]
MDYSALTKLAITMGEEFKVIDSVTLEAINVQRLITREKEYCATLDALIKSSQEEINNCENETSKIKCKLDDITNRGSLLESSMESLNRSHSMVEMLKRDLLKQLQLEEIRTSEQNIKFESTVNKYEDMWKHYKDIYQKFPLVSDLHAAQLKFKLESIQLSILEKEFKDIGRNISQLISIQDKKEKSLILKVAEKYIFRESLKKERDDLERNIKLKRSHIENEKLQKPQMLSFMSSASSNEEKLVTDTVSVLMDNFIMELAKEKLIPLPVFDSPPRKIRSVGNLMSPLKEWTREHDYEAEVKSLHPTESVSNNLTLSCGSDANELITKELDSIPTGMDVDLPKSECPKSHPLGNDTATKDKMKYPEVEIPMETDELDESDKGISSSFKYEGLQETKPLSSLQLQNEEGQKEAEAIILPEPEENVDEMQNVLKEHNIISDSPEFTYKPRVAVPSKLEQEPAPVTTSPYFAESSYLNFMDVPKEIVKHVDKGSTLRGKDKKLQGDAKEEITVNDLDSGSVEESKEQCVEPSVQKTVPNSGKEYPGIQLSTSGEIKSTPLKHCEQDMERGSRVVSQVDNSSHGANASNKHLPTPNEETEVKKFHEGNPIYGEQKQFESVAEVASPQPSQMHDDLNISYGSPMNYSQMSYADSIEYQDSYQTFSPEASAIDNSQQFIPGDGGHASIFDSCNEKTGFNYGFAPSSHQSSAASLFGDASSGNNTPNERKQNEVFNFSFDTKSKTPTMFKLF